MGRVKALMMDIESAQDIILSILNYLTDESEDHYSDQNNIYVDFLRALDSQVKMELSESNMSLVNFIHDNLGDILDEALHSDEDQPVVVNRLLSEAVSEYFRLFGTKVQSKRIDANSSAFYQKQIDTLHELLENSKTESEQHKNDVSVIQYKLMLAESRLQSKKEDEEAQGNWQNKISKAFDSLEKHLEPINKEKERLNKMFWIYLRLMAIVCVALVAYILMLRYFEMSSNDNESVLDYSKYWPFPLLIAIAFGLLTQANRAQRLLVIVVKDIHAIQYIEGLLLTINELSPSVEDSIKRINTALDRLIDNYLSKKEGDLDSLMVKAENKDSVPMDTIIKLLKEIKGAGK